MRISVYFGEEGVFNRELDSDRVAIGSCEVSDEKKISVKQELIIKGIILFVSCPFP